VGVRPCVGARMRRSEASLPEESRALAVPPVAAHLRAAESFLDPAVVRARMNRQLGERNFPLDVNAPVRPGVSAEIFEALEQSPSDPIWAAGLLESCLRHPAEVVRVAAAAAYHPFTTERERILRILVQGTYSNDTLVRELAATALAQARPDHGRINELTSRARAAGTGGPSHTTLLVHGTFARQEKWWQPGGDLHTYLTSLLPTLPRTPAWSAPYAAADRFDWTGGYSDKARSDAADQLAKWVAHQTAEGLDLFAHSYGGNVVMLATTLGLNIGELVLLSCPALPGKYFPDFARIRGPIVSFRVHLDLVLLADSYVSGADLKFNDARIQEHILAIWFDHSATHDPRVWTNAKYQLPQNI
jgi:pimeloyl-ACP methyl ester carboxylesterase